MSLALDSEKKDPPPHSQGKEKGAPETLGNSTSPTKAIASSKLNSGFLSKWVVSPTERPGIQAFRSLLTAWVAFLVDWLILEALLLIPGTTPWFMKIFSYPSGILTTYILSRHWVFPNRRFQKTSKELVLYLLGALVALGLASSILALLEALVPMMDYRWGNALAMAVVFLWNFLYRRYFLFKLPSQTQ